MFKIRRHTDPSYNLPADTVYFIESQWNDELNEFVFTHQKEIERELARASSELFPLSFQYVSRHAMSDAALVALLRLLHPGWSDSAIHEFINVKRSAGDKFNLQNTFHSPRARHLHATLICRLLPDSECREEFLLLEEDVELGYPENFLGEIAEFRQRLVKENTTNLADRPSDHSVKSTANRLKELFGSMQRKDRMTVLDEMLGIEFINKNIALLPPPSPVSLEIDENYRLFLPGCLDKEVVMNPESKALFLLYLSYPQGITLRDLTQYGDELSRLYCSVSDSHTPNHQLNDLMQMLTDPTLEMLYEKIGAIRAAFYQHVDSGSANLFVPYGEKGQPKKIRAERSLISFRNGRP